MQMYDRVLAIDPNHANTICHYGLVLQAEGQNLTKSVEYFDRAVEVDPLHAPSLGFKGMILHTAFKNLTGAEECYQKALKITPTDPIVLSNYAQLHQARNNLGAAESLLKLSLKHDPSHVATLSAYAQLQNERRDYEGATELYVRAYKSDPHNVVTLIDHALLLATRMKKFEEALEILRRAQARDRSGDTDSDVQQAIAHVKQLKVSLAKSTMKKNQIGAKNRWSNYYHRRTRSCRSLGGGLE